MPVFRLRKWYLDSVDARGDAVIVNWARLTYGPLSLSYSAAIAVRDGELTSHTSWKACDEPRVEGDRVVWRNEALGVEGEWRSLSVPADPASRTLLSRPDGEVKWGLISDLAFSSVKCGGAFFCGNGYIEQLEMTLPPWRLPIDELRWGRSYSLNETAIVAVTWIDWRGAHPLSLMLINGDHLEQVEVTDGRISGRGRHGAVTVELPPEGTPGTRVLRDGPLVTGALRGAPGLSKWAPASILAAHECKRLSRCVVRLTEHGALHGWAVHEVVRFRAKRDSGSGWSEAGA